MFLLFHKTRVRDLPLKAILSRLDDLYKIFIRIAYRLKKVDEKIGMQKNK